MGDGENNPARTDSRPHYEATWKQVIEFLIPHGVTIYKTESGYALLRIVGTMPLYYALPIGFDPANPDSVGVPSPLAIYSIERNLDVKLPYYHVM